MSAVPKIGAFVLETLTTGMYINPLDAVREFVQNSADAIRHAEQKQLIAKGEGRIKIEIEPKTRTFIVADNGVGISQADAADRLINIGMSDKRIERDAGFRGIGRLAAIAYCDRLIFRTSAAGDSTATQIEIACDTLRGAISPRLRQVEELADVIAKNSRQTHEQCKKEDHLFEVVMERVNEAGSNFLSSKTLEEYLSQVAPVDYHGRGFIFGSKIFEWTREHSVTAPTVALLIKAPDVERQVCKPYKSHYKTAQTRAEQYDVEVKDVRFFPCDASPESPFWLWYGETDLLGMIDDTKCAGLRLRKHNIGLGGPDRVAELFADIAESNRRFNAYYIGEIHVISAEAIPNARRDGFEDSGMWPSIKKQLLPFVRDRCKEVRDLSEARNRPTQKVLSSASRMINEVKEVLDTGLASPKERDKLLEKMEKEKHRATRAQHTRREPDEAKKIAEVVGELGRLQAALEQQTRFGPKEPRSDLDRKQRKILGEVLQIVHETLSGQACGRSDACYKAIKSAVLAKYGSDKK